MRKFYCSLLLFFVSTLGFAQTFTSFSPTAAGMSEIVYIKGSYLNYVTAVRFGGTAASFFYAQNDSTIVAGIAGGSTGAVTLTLPFSPYSLSRPGFTYLLSPQILSFTPPSAGYGDTVTIKGINLLNTQKVYFTDSLALSFEKISDTVIKAVVGNGQTGAVGVGTSGIISYAPDFTHTGPVISSFSPKTGVTGDTITIKGINFTGTTQVILGRYAAASFTVVGDTLIRGVLGQTGPGYIYVKSAEGTAGMEGFISPVITAIDPTFGYRGTVVSIYGSNMLGVTAVKFKDSLATSFTIVHDGLLQAVVPTSNSGNIQLYKGIDSFIVGNFSYFPYRPFVTGFSPAAAKTGDTLTITGTRLLGATQVKIGEVPAAYFTVVSDTKIKAVVARDSYLSSYIKVTNDGITDSIAGFRYIFLPPDISSFAPASGPVGTNVVLKGQYFGATVADNTVYFGSAKAAISAVTDSTITVTVPAGTDHQPISVTTSRMTGYSAIPFNLTFADGVLPLTEATFNQPLHFTIPGNSNPARVVQGDFDGDGKIDLAVVCGYFGQNNNRVFIYRNTSVDRYISFAAPLQIVIGSQSNSGFDISVADMDGDGKLDLVTMSSQNVYISVLKNTSAPGNISFAARVDFVVSSPSGPEGTHPVNLTIADFDKDGRPDIAVANFGLDNWCKVGYARNTTINGIISFGPVYNYPIVDAWNVFASDLNNDRKPDIGVAINVNGSFMKQLNILRNESTQGAIGLQQDESIGPENSIKSAYLVYSDLDADGKTDLISCNQGSTVSVYKNTSSNGGYISFANPLYFSVVNSTLGQGYIADMDADGKPDLIVTSSGKDSVYILRNNSTVGNISFETAIGYKAGDAALGVIAADLDGDGKPDIVTANPADATITVLRNLTGAPIRLCPPIASTTISSNISGSSYQWQSDKNDGNGFINISNSTFYNGTGTPSLQLINIPSSFNGHRYRCLVNGSNYSYVRQVEFYNQWTGMISPLWSDPANWSCGVLPDANTAIHVPYGIVYVDVNATCYSMNVVPPVTVTVNPGVTLTITH
ncbi:MAG: hypothetical protein EOO06_12445 [Chitinophagaceae bacterium]|nr:MAG: hypothetical protein EOO06_12445 [Chitinophagaceae bacterium]